MFFKALTTEELEKFKTDLVEHFSSDESVACGIRSVYYELFSKRYETVHWYIKNKSFRSASWNNTWNLIVHFFRRAGEDASKPVHVMGSTHIIDVILGRQFRISPEAFFQVSRIFVLSLNFLLRKYLYNVNDEIHKSGKEMVFNIYRNRLKIGCKN